MEVYVVKYHRRIISMMLGLLAFLAVFCLGMSAGFNKLHKDVVNVVKKDIPVNIYTYK